MENQKTQGFFGFLVRSLVKNQKKPVFNQYSAQHVTVFTRLSLSFYLNLSLILKSQS